MKKRTALASGFAALVASQAAVLADASAAEWSGFYIGLHAGGVWGDVDVTNVSDATSYFNLAPGGVLNYSPDGVLGGAQLGYNFQFSNWLIGLEASGAGLDFDDIQTVPGDFETLSIETEWLATATARLGYTGWINSLIYVKGGYAAGNIKTFFTDPSGGPSTTGTFSTDETHNGFVVGAGFEHLLSESVSFGVEYNYIDLGETDHSAIASGIGGGLVVNDIEAQLHTVTARLNWHWNPY